jgi:hypothetical protein
VRALAYLDARYVFNQLSRIVRSPGRLALWVPYIALLAFLSFFRLTTAHARAPGLPSATHPLATAAAGAFLAIFGVTIAVAAAGRVTAFRSTAEALLVVNAGVAPLSLAVWLQLRKLCATGSRWLGSILFSFLLIVPRDASQQQLARGFVAALAAAAAVMTAELPAFLIARKPWGKFVAPLGWAFAAAGGLYAAAGFAGSFGEDRFAPAVLAFLRFDPGRLIGTFASSWTAVLLLCCLPLALIASIVLLARDAVPELYAATLQSFEWRNRRRDQTVYEAGTRRTERIPAGALTIVWKEWVGFRRSRGGMLRWLLVFLFWVGLGSGIAWVDANGERGMLLPLVGFGMMMIVLVPLAASVSLLEDLAKPIWWVSQASLRSRIIAWTFAKAWRNGLAFSAFLAVLAIVVGDARAALLALPLGIGLWSSLNALGVALYAAYPSRIDARGPIFFIRALATGVFILPAGMLFGFVSMATRNPLLAAILAAILIVIEGLLAIEFAAARFNENGAGISMLERA